MADHDPFDPTLIDRYLTGTATPEESAELAQLFGRSSALRTGDTVASDLDIDADWASLRERFNVGQIGQEKITTGKASVGRIAGKQTQYMRLFASCALALALIGVTYVSATH